MFEEQTELGALWVKKSLKGQMYFTGKIHLPHGELQVVVLPIKNPNNLYSIPQFRIVKSWYESTKRPSNYQGRPSRIQQDTDN